jgi:hypothetical protein
MKRTLACSPVPALGLLAPAIIALIYVTGGMSRRKYVRLRSAVNSVVTLCWRVTMQGLL